MIKAVIFDMGGTLLQYAPQGCATWRELETPGIRSLYAYLLAQGHPVPDQEDVFVEIMFQRLAEGWIQATSGHAHLNLREWIGANTGSAGLILEDASLHSAARHLAQPIRDSVRAAEGADKLLSELCGRGLRLGLISNTIWPGELHREDLAVVGLLVYFEHTLFSSDLGIWKPQPGIFNRMLSALDVAPEEALFVGDSPLEDIRGAQGVGMRAVWLQNNEFPLGDVQPDGIINQLLDLGAMLNEM